MRHAGRYAVVLALLGMPAAAHAQGDCFPPAGSREVKLFAKFAVPLAFSEGEAPTRAVAGRVRLRLDASYLPKIDSATRTATICRPGKGPEYTDLLFVLPRPRLQVGLPAGFVLEASWVPPVRVNGVKANLLGLSLGQSIGVGSRGVLGLRAHASFGTVHAPITCPDAALADPASECYQGTRSDDSYRPDIFGAEASLGVPVGSGALRPYIGAGVNVLRPRFRVNFTNRVGELDNRRIEADLTRGAVFGGLTWAPARVALSAEVYASPGDAVTARVGVGYMLR